MTVKMDLSWVLPKQMKDGSWEDEYTTVHTGLCTESLIELAATIPNKKHYQFLISEWEEDDLLNQCYLDEWLENFI